MAVILVADDEESLRTLLALLLRSAGHQVLTATNGVEAVALFRSSPDKIDLIVMDLVMPVMDGTQAIRLIRESRPNARIICMSGYTEQECPPGSSFLAKPFTRERLMATLNQLLAAG